MIPRERAGTPPDTGASMKDDDLRALLGRLESATGPDRELEIAIWRLIGGGHDRPADRVPLPWLHRYLYSIDDVVVLLDHFGMSWSKSMEGFVCVHDREGAGTFRPDTESAALPIKLMAGMVRALIARTEPSPDA